jgi:hypothetical protein
VARWLRRFHLFMVCAWALLAIPGLLWWKESITFVVIMSLYANLAAEFAAYQGARSETENGEE